MRKIIEENTKKGFIQESKSLTGALVIFVKKKEWETAYIYGLLIAKYYYSEKLLSFTPDHQIAGPNMRGMLLHKARPVRCL